MLTAVYQLGGGKASWKGLILLSQMAANSLEARQDSLGSASLNGKLEVFMLGPVFFG